MARRTLLALLMALAFGTAFSAPGDWRPLGTVKLANGTPIKVALNLATIRNYRGLLVIDLATANAERDPSGYEGLLFNRHIYNCRTKKFWPVTNIGTHIEAELDNADITGEGPLSGNGWGAIEIFVPVRELTAALIGECGRKRSEPTARQWVPLGVSDAGALAVDLRALTVAGERRTFWVRTLKTKRQEVSAETKRLMERVGANVSSSSFPKVVPEAAYNIARWQIDCRAQTLRLLSSVKYGDATSSQRHPLIDSHEIPPDKQMDSAIVPDSVGASLTQFVCGI